MKPRIFLLTILLAVSLPASARAQVEYDQIVHSSRQSENWLTYGGDYSGKRYSELQQVNTTNVSRLASAWVFQTQLAGKFETTPLVINGIMYFTGPDDHGYALDARTGRAIWRYERNLPAKIPACCGRVNRGFAALRDLLFMATLDAHVIALDAKTGNVVWDVEAADYKLGYTFTVAPLAVKDKVIVGISGGEYGVRGFIDAYDAATGKRAWRFYTVPGPHEPGNDTWAGDSWSRGGAPAWVTGTFDPDLNLIYWGTGNPAPSDDVSERAGDNLYSNCVVALDADTGKLKWHFQFTPADSHDWDATEVPVLVDLNFDGRARKLIAFANRNGFYYLLDRASGKFLLAKPFSRVTWASEVGPDGRPRLLPVAAESKNGTVVCPAAAGATNWMSPSFSTQTGLLYVAVREQCDLFVGMPQAFHPGHPYIGSVYFKPADERPWGALRAIDPLSGQIKWDFKYVSPPWAGALSTAGGLVFSGDMEGYFIAFDARSGKELWHFGTGAPVYASPMTYALDGKQHVVIASGGALFSFALVE
ncbi:MAG TPA: PQQ-dependent dehydrogenase, methanol/ethanol family [Candidatus Limnocylindria bacterium]|nr:PQQ-dependent dehydrogenase, methanol/ethanol family [Candidatus Limnocylindria bacterium]